MFTPSVSPPCTKPTSTLIDGSASLCKLSSPPCEVITCTFTPLRSMILRYLSAVVRNVLPSGPLAMTMVSSGAGRTNLKANQTARTMNSSTGSTMTARSRHDTTTKLTGKRIRRNDCFLFIIPSSGVFFMPAVQRGGLHSGMCLTATAYGKRIACSASRAAHRASRRDAKRFGVDRCVGPPAVAAVFPVVGDAPGAGARQRGDKQGTEQLMILRAHPQFPGVASDAQVFKRSGDVKRFDRLCLHRCRCQQAQHVPQLLEAPVVASLALEIVRELRAASVCRITHPGHYDFQVFLAGTPDYRRQTFQCGAEDEISHVQTRFPAGANQQRKIAAPIPRHHSVRARRPDFRDIRREVLDLRQRMQIVAVDGHVRAPGGNALPRGAADRLAPGIVLVDEINLADRRLFAQILRQCDSTHVTVRIKTEVPELAFRIGHFGIEAAVVEKQDRLPGIAAVMLGNAVAQGEPDVRANALGNIANALADGRLQRDQSLLGAQLVVVIDDFQPCTAEQPALLGDVIRRRMQLARYRFALQRH